MINHGSSLVQPYEFTNDLCGLFLNNLYDLESRDKVHYSELRDKRPSLRNSLIQRGIIKHDSDLLSQNSTLPPSCCAIDGSRTLERGKRGDIILIGATRFNNEKSLPLHIGINNVGFATYSRHYDLNSNLAAALMSRYELILAANSASQLVMLDGSISSAILANNLVAHARFTTPLTVEFNRNLYEFHLAARTILDGIDDNRIYVSCPKATEKQEISYEMEWERTYPDLLSFINEKELLNHLLKAGEYTTALQLTSRADVYDGNRSTLYNWNIFPASLIERDNRINSICEGLKKALKDTMVCYYKPHENSEVIRMEFSNSITMDEEKMATLLTTMKHYVLPNNLIKEPVLLYQADFQAKRQISSAARVYKTRLRWQNYRTDQDEGILGDA
jgi:hypothetical protein